MSRNNGGNGDKETRPVHPTTETPSAGLEPITAKQVWNVFRRRWWLALGTAAVVSALGMYYVNQQPAIYDATAAMIVATSHTTPATAEDLGMLSDLITLAREKSAQGQAQIISSPALLYEATQKLSDDQLQRGYNGIESTIYQKILPDWAVNTDVGKSSDVISITVKAYDPQVAADLANTIVETYMEHDKGLLGQTAQQGREYIASEMKSVQDQLDTARKELAKYKHKTGLVVPESQLSSFAAKVIALQADLDKSRIDLISANKKTDSLHRQLISQGVKVEESQTMQRNPQYQALLTQMDDLVSQSISINQEYAPESKQVKRLQASIADTSKRLKQATQTIVASSTRGRNPLVMDYSSSLASTDSLAARTKALEKIVAERSKQMDVLPDNQRIFAQLSQRVQTLESTYQALVNKHYAMIFNERSTLPNTLFAATARPPLTPSYPNKHKHAMAFLLLGIVTGITASILAERMDSRVPDISAVAKLTDQRILSRVPNVRKVKNPNLITGNVKSDSAFAESFRILRNNLYFAIDGRTVKTLAITSPGRGDGKGTTCLNLAATAAMCGVTVLVVDCDFRRPSLHERIGAPRNIGLSNLVEGLAKLEDVIIATETPNVYCLPSGPAPKNPAEYLISQKCYQTLKEFSVLYDLVVFDCPPCAGLSDMQGISRLVDGILMIVSLGRTSKTGTSNAFEILDQVDAHIIGTVVNRAHIKRDIYDHYRHHDNSRSGASQRNRITGNQRAVTADKLQILIALLTLMHRIKC